MIEQLSIDVTNKCDKGCWFCYNHSTSEGQTKWTGDELLSFAVDCVDNGVRAISFGGGEPLAFVDLFKVTKVLGTKAFVSVTTNGLLLDTPEIFSQVMDSGIDKLHITIHFPENQREVDRVTRQILRLQTAGRILCGVNLLISEKNYLMAKNVYKELRRILSPKDIILVPQRYGDTPSPKQLLTVSDGEPFQSPSCLLQCGYSGSFCSVSYDKKVNWCSFAGGKEKLHTLGYKGLVEALGRIKFAPCGTQ